MPSISVPNQVPEIDLIYKSAQASSDRSRVRQSSDAYTILMQSWDENKIDFVEQAKVLLLNRAKQALGICTISSGGVAGTVVDPKLVFIAAIKANASSIILAHNHPSGNLQHSKSDTIITERCKEAGLLLDIDLTDHLIISREGYYSFAEDKTTYAFELIDTNFTPF